MLTTLSRLFRCKAAFAVAVLYAFCILVPSAAFAFGDQENAAHCLKEGLGLTSPAAASHGHAHPHADGTSHTHSDHGAPQKHSHDDGKGHAATCCGLFSVVAIAGSPADLPHRAVVSAKAASDLQNDLTGRGPARIHRPPIA